MATQSSLNSRAPLQVGEMLISLALVVLGAFVVYETTSITEGGGYAQIGPRLFPYIVGAGLTLCGAVLGWQALRGGWRNVPLDREGHAVPDWSAFIIISVGAILHMALIAWAGFIIVSTLLFALIARAFGSRRTVRDALIGIALSVAVFLIFTVGLGLNLPKGPFGGG